ncbi:uncharacterized protein KY384_008732 [Bacidia gigantensis]|uniref:uncharacterized protein n=1 Tax=Bacidia gigantensis TaxID=2732470 RepID=UPI001D058C88|nr:uncharacterized protein KY384_008732 [Bacidia gigantensis]KAG8526532.1 hypothetical protein KY384_008732 [Bacidia gigantensis]
MAPTDLILPSNSLVLVTGASGYIASHIVDQLLERGYRVRGSVRNAAKSSFLNELYSKRHGDGKFELIGIADYMKPEGYTEALKDVTGVIHTVGDTSFSPDPDVTVPNTVAIATSLLTAALSIPAIKRVVFTSSSVAIAFPEPNKVFPVNASIFNDGIIAAAYAAPKPYDPNNFMQSFLAYAASKVSAEHAIEKFVAEQKPKYAINVICPNTVLGEVLAPEHQDGSTSGLVTSLYTGKKGTWSFLPPQYYVNVKDVARLHVAALIVPGVEGERLLGYAKPFSQTEILGYLRKLEPGKEFEKDPEGEGRDVSEVDSKRSEVLVKVLKNGEGWTSLEETVGDNVKHLQGK